MMYEQKTLIRHFQDMHQNAGMFVLPNAWDAGSARIFEKQGFKAVATSSAGIAYSLGFPDGEDISFNDLLCCVRQIIRRIEIPLSVDFERGYGEDRHTIQENARELLRSGVCGFNIEDGKSDGTLDPLDFMLDKITALNELKSEFDLDFVINARTCAYWHAIGDEDTMFSTAVERGNAFRRAGADCVFIPGPLDERTVRKLVQGIDAPLNIILNPRYHDFAGLERLGVRRLSVGSGPARSVYNHLIEVATELHDGHVSAMLDHPFTYTKANAYFRE